jgi:hypothetical protein
MRYSVLWPLKLTRETVSNFEDLQIINQLIIIFSGVNIFTKYLGVFVVA